MQGGIFSATVLADGTILTGGGKDHRIAKWTSELEEAGEATVVRLTKFCQGHSRCVHASSMCSCVFYVFMRLLCVHASSTVVSDEL